MQHPALPMNKIGEMAGWVEFRKGETEVQAPGPRKGQWECEDCFTSGLAWLGASDFNNRSQMCETGTGGAGLHEQKTRV